MGKNNYWKRKLYEEKYKDLPEAERKIKVAEAMSTRNCAKTGVPCPAWNPEDVELLQIWISENPKAFPGPVNNVKPAQKLFPTRTAGAVYAKVREQMIKMGLYIPQVIKDGKRVPVKPKTPLPLAQPPQKPQLQPLSKVLQQKLRFIPDDKTIVEIPEKKNSRAAFIGAVENLKRALLGISFPVVEDSPDEVEMLRRQLADANEKIRRMKEAMGG